MSQIPKEITVESLKARSILNTVLNRLQQDINPPADVSSVALDIGLYKSEIPEEAIDDILLTIMESTLTSYGIDHWGNDAVAKALFSAIISKTNDKSFHAGKYSGDPSKVIKFTNIPNVIGTVESYICTYSRPAVEEYFREAFEEEGILPPSRFISTLKNMFS